ncbi:MAG: hypothetical protein ACREHG_07255 [Candidatus Saccharimonadales bacterium]
MFIGYAEGYKGWKFYNPATKKVVISERADFDERYFWNNTAKPAPAIMNSKSNSTSTPEPSPAFVENDPILTQEGEMESNLEPEVESLDPEPEQETLVEDPEPEEIVPRCSTRIRRAPREWWTAWENEEEQANLALQPNEPNSYREAMRMETAEKWKEAMEEEYNAHLGQGTWDLVDLPQGQKAIGS